MCLFVSINFTSLISLFLRTTQLGTTQSYLLPTIYLWGPNDERAHYPIRIAIGWGGGGVGSHLIRPSTLWDFLPISHLPKNQFAYIYSICFSGYDLWVSCWLLSTSSFSIFCFRRIEGIAAIFICCRSRHSFGRELASLRCLFGEIRHMNMRGFKIILHLIFISFI